MDHKISVPWLLVATPQLQDPNFKNAVVLVVEHNDDGAMGFIVNRPSQAPLTDLVSADDFDIPSTLPAWVGGPVDTTTGFILHNQPEDDPDLDLATGITLSSSSETLKDMVNDADRRIAKMANLDLSKDTLDEEFLYPYRFLVGYAGWSADQLEEEIRTGAWIQAPVDRDILFNAPWNKMWDRVMASVGINPRILAPAPQPYLN
jgi:putative transcriptional regulator